MGGPGALGGGNGPQRVFAVTQGDVADDGLGGGVDELGLFAPVGGDEGAVDVDLVDVAHGGVPVDSPEKNPA
jgi:hypothetical protein